MRQIWGTVGTRGFNLRGVMWRSRSPCVTKLHANSLAVRLFSNQNYITPFLINNQEIISSKKFDVRAPFDSKLLWSASAASLSDVEKVTQAAAAAFPSWSSTRLVERRDLLFRFADILTERGNDLTKCMCLETAAQAPWAEFNIKTSIGIVKEVAGRLTSITGTIPESAEEGRSVLVFREPYGVVLAIAPWNAPIILAMRAVLFPLAAGNTVIFKSSEMSPRTHFLLASLFAEAGLPPGVLNVIGHTRQDGAEITNALISRREVRKINFTGSTIVGRKIAAKAGEYLKPVLLELGGKAPFIVFEDADIEGAAEAAALGSFLHGGQICMATEKIVVHSSVVDRFTKALAAAAQNFSESQSLVLPEARQRIHDLVDSAVRQGAKIVNAGSYKTNLDGSTTAYPNTIVRDVTDKMEIYHMESFGPVVSIVTFNTEEEAAEIANDTEYGLNSAIWTRNLGRALRIAKRIEAGAVHINGATVHDEPHLPHGGRKESGYGRFGGGWGLDEFLTTKTVTYKL